MAKEQPGAADAPIRRPSPPPLYPIPALPTHPALRPSPPTPPRDPVMELQLTTFGSIEDIPLLTPDPAMPAEKAPAGGPPVFIGKSEEGLLRLKKGKKKEAMEARDETAGLIEEQVVEKGRDIAMKAMRRVRTDQAAVPGEIRGVKASKPRGQLAAASASSARTSASAAPGIRPWPTVRLAARPARSRGASAAATLVREADVEAEKEDRGEEGAAMPGSGVGKTASLTSHPAPPQVLPDLSGLVHPAQRHQPQQQPTTPRTSLSRRTMREMVLELGFPLPPTTPPVPPMPALRPSSSAKSSSGYSSLLDAYASTPSPTGNAFAPDGFWAAHGIKSEPKLADILRREQELERQRLSAETFESPSLRKTSVASVANLPEVPSLASPKTAPSSPRKTPASESKKVSWGSSSLGRAAGRPIISRGRGYSDTSRAGRDTASHRRQSSIEDYEEQKRESLEIQKTKTMSSTSSAQKRVSFGVPESEAAKPETDIFADDDSDRSYTTSSFLLSLGVRASVVERKAAATASSSKSTGEDHPFANMFVWISKEEERVITRDTDDQIAAHNPDLREAFLQIKETLIEMWHIGEFGGQPKEQEPTAPPGHRTLTREPSKISLTESTHPQRPLLRSKASKFRLFSREKSDLPRLRIRTSDSLECVASESLPNTPAPFTPLPVTPGYFDGFSGLPMRSPITSTPTPFPVSRKGKERAREEDTEPLTSPAIVPSTPMPTPISRKGKERMREYTEVTTPAAAADPIPPTPTATAPALPISQKTLRALRITRLVMQELQAQFKTPDCASLSEYVLSKPSAHAASSNRHSADESALHARLPSDRLRTADGLRVTHNWKQSKSLHDWVDRAYINDPAEYEFETVLERELAGLRLLRSRRAETAIPGAALRIMWATRFYEAMVQRVTAEIAVYEQQTAGAAQEAERHMAEELDITMALASAIASAPASALNSPTECSPTTARPAGRSPLRGVVASPSKGIENPFLDPVSEEGDSWSDDDVRYARMLQEVNTPATEPASAFANLQSPREGGSASSSTAGGQGSPAETLSPGEAKKRRRKATWNRGLVNWGGEEGGEEGLERIEE